MAMAVIDRLSQGNIDELYQLYLLEWWSEEREPLDIRVMLEKSDEIVAFIDSDSKSLIAFSRVLTDYVYKAIIFDVIVEKSFRDRGLGKKLMESIISHPKLQSVRDFELYCHPEMLDYYDQFGFIDLSNDLCFLRLRK